MIANTDTRTVQALRSDLALQIARHIRCSGQTQVAAAKRLAVPQPTVSQIMHGKVSQLSLELLIRIAVRAELPVVLQTGKDAEEAGAFVAGKPLQESRILRSKVADEARQALSEDARNLTPQQRLEAHARHSQLMVALRRGGPKEQKGSMKARWAGQSAYLLLDVSAVLAENDVEYAVIGAMAAAVYGAIRATTDADALLSVSVARLGRLEKIFKKAGFATELRREDADDPIPALLSVSDRHDNRVDLLAGLRGLDRLAFSRSITVPFLGSSLRVIGREDFVAMKCFAGGPQDIADAVQALKTADQPLDFELLRRTTRRFGRPAADLLEKLLRV